MNSIRAGLIMPGTLWLLISACTQDKGRTSSSPATSSGTAGQSDIVVTGQLAVSDLPEAVVGNGVVKAGAQEVQVTDANGNIVGKTYTATDGSYAAVVPGSLVIDTSSVKSGSGDAVPQNGSPGKDQGTDTGKTNKGPRGIGLADTTSTGLSIGATILKTADDSVVGFKQTLALTAGSSHIKLGTTQLKKLTAIRGIAQLDGARDHTGILVYVPGTSFAARTDVAGVFVMTGIEAGTYNLQFEKDGFVSTRVSDIAVQKDETSKVTTQILKLSGGASNFVVKQIGTEGFSRSRTVEFLISAGSADRFKGGLTSELPGLSYGAVPSSWTYTFTADGTYDLVLTFADADGFETTVQRRVTVDTVAPSSTGISLVDRSDLFVNLTNERPVLAWHATCDDIAKVAITAATVSEPKETDFAYQCYATSSSDISFTLPTGVSSYDYKIWVRDAAGNQSATAATGTIVLDTTAPGAPSVTLSDQTSGSSLGTDITTVNVTFNSCTDTKSILISESQLLPPLASQFALTCTTTANAYSYTFANNIQGTKTLLAWALDQAGNVGQISTTLTITLDSTQPTASSFTLADPTPTTAGISNSLTLVATPANCTDTTHVLVSETQSTRPSETATGWQACSLTGVSATALGQGTRTFYLWARDIGGNVSLTATTATIVVDTVAPTAPTLTLADLTNPTADASAYTNAQTISSTIGSCADASYVLLTESATTPSVAAVTTACSTSAHNFTLDSTANGLKTVYLWVLDSAGNLSSTASSAQITMDTALPSLPATFALTDVDTSSANYTNSTTVHYAINACTTGEYLLLKQDQSSAPAETSSDWASCATSGDWANLVTASAGTKTVYLWRKDRAGNITGSLSDALDWDSTAPGSLAVSSPVSTWGTYYTTSASVNVVGTGEANAGVGITGGSTTATGTVDNSGNFSIAVSLNNNTTHTLSLTATDEPGNASSAVSITVVRDTVAPTNSDVAISLTDSTASITWSTNEYASHTFEYGTTVAYGSSSNDSSFNTSHSASLSSLSSGTTYYYRIRATDQAGNTDNANQLTGSFKTYIPKSGTISSNETWSDTTTAYYVSGNVAIDSGVTVTISPGVQVAFASGRRINVSGSLVARGNSGSHITFTSNQQTHTTNFWDGINFAATSSAPTFDGSGNYSSGNILEYVDIGYGSSSGPLIKLVGATGIAIYNCTLAKSGKVIGFAGAQAYVQMESDSSVYIKNSTFNDIASYGVLVATSTSGGGTLEVKNSTFSSSSSATSGQRTYMIINGSSLQLNSLTITGNTFTEIQGYNSSNYGTAIDGSYWTSNAATISSNIFQSTDYYVGAINYYGPGTIEKNIILLPNYGNGIQAATGADNQSLTVRKNIIESGQALYVGSSGQLNATYSVTGNVIMPLYTVYTSPGVTLTTSQTAAFTLSNNLFQRANLSGSSRTSSLVNLSPSTSSTITSAGNNFINNTLGLAVLNERLAATVTMNFQANWWGTSNTTTIDSLIYDNTDNGNLSVVDVTSALSAPSTTAPISSPTNLNLTDNGSGHISLSWTGVSESDKAGYKVYYKYGSSGYPYNGTGATQGSSGIDVGSLTSYTLDLPTGQNRTYYISVTAYDASADATDDIFDGNESWYATEVSVTVP